MLPYQQMQRWFGDGPGLNYLPWHLNEACFGPKPGKFPSLPQTLQEDSEISMLKHFNNLMIADGSRTLTGGSFMPPELNKSLLL